MLSVFRPTQGRNKTLYASTRALHDHKLVGGESVGGWKRRDEMPARQKGRDIPPPPLETREGRNDKTVAEGASINKNRKKKKT